MFGDWFYCFLWSPNYPAKVAVFWNYNNKTGQFFGLLKVTVFYSAQALTVGVTQMSRTVFFKNIFPDG